MVSTQMMMQGSILMHRTLYIPEMASYYSMIGVEGLEGTCVPAQHQVKEKLDVR